jgi:hypothetical protein
MLRVGECRDEYMIVVKDLISMAMERRASNESH